MDPIKISVDVNINFSENMKAFLVELFTAQRKSEVEPTKQAETQAAPIQSAQPVKTPKPADNAPSAPAAPAHSTPASSAIKIDQVRKALSEKVNDHRATIKAKLEEFGAPSVTKLDPTKYEEMYNFLTSL